VGLERDLLCGVLERLVAEPDAMPLFPDCANVAAAMTQKEALDALASLANILAGNLPRANEVAHGLMGRIWYPDCCELSSTREPRQHECIAPVGLDVITS